MLALPKRRAKRPAQKRRLTELCVRKAKAQDKPHVIWDTQQRGLALRIWPTGKKSWYAVYSRQGRPRWLYFGDASAETARPEAMAASTPSAEKRSSGVPWKLVGDVIKSICPFVLPLYLAVGFGQGLSKTFDGRIVSQLLRPAEKRIAHK